MRAGHKFLTLKNPIVWGLLLTFTLFCAVIFLAIQLGPDGKTRVALFLSSPPNLIGDTIAGFFSSLAFIWIVVTVFLQGHELREQREELRLTRDELKLAREAQESQLKVMQKQADIFDDEKRRRDQEAARQHFEELCKSLARAIFVSEFANSSWEYGNKRGQMFRTTPLKEIKDSPDYDSFFPLLAGSLRNFRSQMKHAFESFNYVNCPSRKFNTSEIENFVERIRSLQADLSAAQIERESRMNLGMFVHEMVQIHVDPSLWSSKNPEIAP